MPGTVSNTNIIPMWVVFNNVNLGLIDEGDITLTITQKMVERMSHQTGDFSLDYYYGGAKLTCEFSLSETAEKDSWVAAFGFGEKQVDTSTPPEERFVFTPETNITNGTFIGQKASSIAQELILIPVVSYVTTTTETNNNVHIPKAFCSDVGGILHGIDSGHNLPCTFTALFDPTQADGEALAYIGKKTEGTGNWVAA